MSKHTVGLDKAAIGYAIKQTAQREIRASIASAALWALAMQLAVGAIHPLGVIGAFIIPLLLSTPTTLVMHLKNQQLRAANKQLNILASTDWLTGAMNRRSFSLKVEEHLQSNSCHAKTQNYALLLLDVDNFKSINDACGHEGGDIAMQTMVGSIRTHFGLHVPFGRIGGDEYAMFIADLGGQGACEIAKAVCKQVNTIDYSAAGLAHPISVSIGVATSAEGDSLQQLFRIADRKMYLAKNKGRNCVESEHFAKPDHDMTNKAA